MVEIELGSSFFVLTRGQRVSICAQYTFGSQLMCLVAGMSFLRPELSIKNSLVPFDSWKSQGEEN